MPSRRPLRRVAPALCLVVSGISVGHAQTPAQVERFEKNARPLFSSKCQGCHNAKLKSGGLDFSSLEAIKEVASMGIFGKPSEPEGSVLLRALSYENQIKMPPQGKLPPETITAIREWLAAGAPAPAATPSAGNS